MRGRWSVEVGELGEGSIINFDKLRHGWRRAQSFNNIDFKLVWEPQIPRFKMLFWLCYLLFFQSFTRDPQQCLFSPRLDYVRWYCECRPPLRCRCFAATGPLAFWCLLFSLWSTLEFSLISIINDSWKRNPN